MADLFETLSDSINVDAGGAGLVSSFPAVVVALEDDIALTDVAVTIGTITPVTASLTDSVALTDAAVDIGPDPNVTETLPTEEISLDDQTLSAVKVPSGLLDDVTLVDVSITSVVISGDVFPSPKRDDTFPSTFDFC